MLKKKFFTFFLICMFNTLLLFSCNNKNDFHDGPLSSYYYNKKLMIEKGLANDEDTTLTREYISLQNLYRKILSQYLLDSLDIKKYDNKFIDSELNFLKKPEKYQTVEQKSDFLELEYIYLRNVLYIENLNIEDLNLLRNFIEKDNSIKFKELLEMVKRTFLDVITIDKDTKNLIIMYDNDYDNKIPHDAILFKISTYPHYDSEGNSVDKKNEEEKDKFIIDIKERMESELSGKLGDVKIYVVKDMRKNTSLNWNKLN